MAASELLSLFNVAGGVRYHLRGMLSASRAWAPFRAALGGWLSEWRPGGDRLVIVGSSAGYCLESEWLGRFEEIACLDPDPVARWLFTRRVRAVSPRARIEWCSDDFLREREPSEQQEVFSRFLARYPGAPVLFSNFLGQLPILLGDTEASARTLARWKSKLVPELLADRDWASFHDRVSGPLAPLDFTQPHRAPARLTDAEIVERFYPTPKGNASPVELSDHETEGFFPREFPHAYLRWPLTPGWIHLIEAVHSVRSASMT